MNHASVPLSYDLLKEITDDFSEERKIGSGTYGIVYKGVYKDGKTIAVKMLYNMPGLDDVQFKREFNNLTILQHGNIVRLVGYCYEIRKEWAEYNGNKVLADKIHRALCFEYAPNGSLRENLSDEFSGHDWRTRYRIIKGICNGLKYLHQDLKPPMYHLDIKPGNVLLYENMSPKVADFGLSRLFGEEQTKITMSSLGTCGYLPPEYIEQNVISNKFDIFSLGVVIIKVMAGRDGYSICGEMSSQKFIKLVHGNWRNRFQTPSMYKPEPYYEQVKTCIEISLRCVETDRRKRPSITDIVDKMNETEIKIRLWPPIEKYFSPASRYLYGLEGITGLRRFEYSELATLTDGFSKDNTHGEGAFGTVYKGSYADENGRQEVAVKKINQTTEVATDFIAELEIIGGIRHMNLVKLKGWCCSRNISNLIDFMGCFRQQTVELFLVFELPPNGNLNNRLHHSVRTLSWQKRYQIIKCIGSALRYLHHECDKPILHGRIYPSNILLDNDFNAILADFGLLRIATLADCVKASAYTDPQCFEDGEVQFSCKSDVYSFGIVLLDIACTGKSRAQVQQLYRRSAAEPEVMKDAADRRLRGVFDKREMERVIALGLRCSHRDEKQRPYMVDAMKFLEEGIELPALGVHKHGETIAVKMLYDMLRLDDEQFMREFNNLMGLQYRNIVWLAGYCHDTRQECVEHNGKMVVADRIHRALCFEYAHNGSLHDNLFDESNGHDWRTRYGIIKGICNGLEYLHHELKPPMYHLDLKPANVLLDENMLPKIADFVLSRLFGQEQTKITKSLIGTRYWQDLRATPNVLKHLPGNSLNLMDGNTNSTSGSGCKSCGPLTQYYIPDYILKPDSEQVIVDNAPCCPVVVFINSRSGGQLGSGLIKMYRELLNKAQVFDLSEESPDKVLHRLYANFEKLKSDGDILAVEIERKLRLIVAGGDGTASWLLGVVSDLKLSHPPPVAPLPLGTENNLPFSFGWGQKKPATEQEAAKSFLGLVKGAAEMNVDSWHIIMRMRVPQEGPCDPIAPVELPHSLHAFHCVSGSDLLNVEGYHTFRGGFWNYFSMGMDAQVSYGFHSERKKNPKFKIQLTNQGTYAKLGLKQGWFPSLAHPSSRNIAQLAKVKIMKRPGRLWEELKIPSSIRSIICLNLPSFSGGFNPWGTPGTRKAEDRDLTAPYVDDGLIEVVGFRDAWHGLVLLAPKGHGTRLAQAHRIRFEFHKGAADHTFMMVDGEPWKQPLPKDDETVVVEISHRCQVTMLANHPCKSKSIDDPTSPSHRGEGECDSDSLEDEDEWHEGRRKFGVADSFKLPDEVEIAHLS